MKQSDDNLILDSLISINCMYIFKISLSCLFNYTEILAHWIFELELADIAGTWHQEESNGQTYNPKNITGFLPYWSFSGLLLMILSDNSN